MSYHIGGGEEDGHAALIHHGFAESLERVCAEGKAALRRVGEDSLQRLEAAGIDEILGKMRLCQALLDREAQRLHGILIVLLPGEIFHHVQGNILRRLDCDCIRTEHVCACLFIGRHGMWRQ